jgi:hypothetical protein
MTVSQTTRLGIYRWSEDTDAFTRSQMDNSHENIEDRVARFESGTTLPSPAAEYARSFFFKTDEEALYYYDAEDGSGSWVAIGVDNISVTSIDAKGDLLVGTASDTISRLAVGSNDTILKADSSTASGLAWSSSISGLTLTSPSIVSPALSAPNIYNPQEPWLVSATALTGTVNIDLANNNNQYFSSSATGNWVPNIRWNSTTTFNSRLANQTSATVAIAVTQGATAYRPTGFSIDGVSYTPRWQGGTAPTFGNANSIDVYLYLILKTSTSPTYVVFASQTRFA